MELSSEQGTGQKLSDARNEAEPKYVELALRWKNNPRWYKTDVTHAEYAELMSKGMVDGKSIAAVTLWYQDDSCLIYDFEAAGTGNNPWKIEKT